MGNIRWPYITWALYDVPTSMLGVVCSRRPASSTGRRKRLAQHVCQCARVVATPPSPELCVHAAVAFEHAEALLGPAEQREVGLACVAVHALQAESVDKLVNTCDLRARELPAHVQTGVCVSLSIYLSIYHTVSVSWEGPHPKPYRSSIYY